MFTLYQLLESKGSIQATDAHKNNFVKLMGGRGKTPVAMRKCANDNFSRLPSLGIFKRVEFEEGGNVVYTAGQYYPGEIQFLRDTFKKYY